ncbi:MAG: HRDC domain-containing protein, partial [Pseudomonadota bacterium]
RQDLEVLYITTNRLPNRVFDTQIAAGLTGMPPQVGYATLVERVCEVKLDKAHTRTDWSRRPLARAVLDYAADDVRYLPAIRDYLEERLTSLGRTDWADADNRDLLETSLYEVDASQAWRRIKGIGRTPSGVQQILRALAAWREDTAINRNLPRQWIARDELLLDVAFKVPDSVDALADLDAAKPKFVDRYGATIIDVLKGDLPPPPAQSVKPDEAEKKRVKAMAGDVREIAASLAIEAEILAPQRELRQAAKGIDTIRALKGWRRDVVGDAILAKMP